MLYEKEQLLKAIASDIEIVAIWGAYQILKLEESEIESYLPFFLGSQFVDIQDAGIAKIAEMRYINYTAEITRIFRESEGQVKYTAGYAISCFPNDFSKSLLQKWFDYSISSNSTTRAELEAATYAFLNLSREAGFPVVLKALYSTQKDIIRNSVLFNNLLLFCDRESEYKEVLRQYFVLRDEFSDAEISINLIDTFVYSELREWLAGNLSRGYTISSIYEQCYRLLGTEDSIADRQFWLEIQAALGDSGVFYKSTILDGQGFIEAILQWIRQIVPNTDEKRFQHLLWSVEVFKENAASFSNTIPKIIELETHFLLSIPLYIHLETSVRSWLADPFSHVEKIANYYHSTLLIREYREKILSLFFPALPEWSEEDVRITSDDSPIGVEDNINSIIWAFYRGDLLGYKIPWPTIFPNPDCSIHLAEGLAKIYYRNFEYFVERNDRVSIDYALQLFQLKPHADAIRLLKKHFSYLCRNHSETLYQTIEYLPDSSFIEYLRSNYVTGEKEIARLILLISEIFSIELEESIKKDILDQELNGLGVSGMKKLVRLHCDHCSSTFQYALDTVYVDESAVLRLNRLSQESIWVPQTFHCKKCEAEVPFVLDENQLDELSQQSRVDRILKITPQSSEHQFGYKTSLIDFPRHNGRTYSPGEFFELITQLETSSNNENKIPHISKDELKILWMKQARLKKAMGKWQDCKDALEQIKSLEKIDEEWMYLMGFVCFKLSLFADARRYFDWIVKKHPEDLVHSSHTPFVEKSKYFINVLDSKESKRSRFKVITRKR